MSHASSLVFKVFIILELLLLEVEICSEIEDMTICRLKAITYLLIYLGVSHSVALAGLEFSM